MRTNAKYLQIAIRLAQPLGFILLLAYFAFPTFSLTLYLFWLGMALSLLGIWFELRTFMNTPKKKRNQTNGIFGFGVVLKLILLVAIALRINDYPKSLYILLGALLVSFLWGILSLAIKPEKKGNSDILDE